jgi:putative DNA primase/helicase
MINLPDFSSYCEAACLEYWGQPDRKNFKELRWGPRDGYGGRSLSIKKKSWYDADAERGGSTLELIAIEEGYTDADGKPDTRGKRFFEVWRIGYDKKIITEPPPEPRAPIAAKIRKVFPYTDEQGKHLYDVVRFDTTNPDERFRYRLPSGEWKLGRTRRVLYRLPAVISAVKADALILVTEGEKDAETAVALGYVATTACGGVGEWRDAYDKSFAGADVVIVADNDQHGRGQEHAADVAAHLRKVARRVRVIMFPQKDLTEWVKAGGDRAALDLLITQADHALGSGLADAAAAVN